LAKPSESSAETAQKSFINRLVVGVVLCIVMTMFVNMHLLSQRSRDLQSLVASLGGKVELENIAPEWLPARVRESDVFLRATEVHLAAFPNWDALLDALSANVDGYNELFTREQPLVADFRVARDVGRVSSLRALFLDSYSIGDDDLAKLASLRHVEVLTIAKTNCTNDGLKHLQGWPCLTQLRCSSLPLDDGAVPHLEQLPALTHLDVSHTQISEAGVARLAAIPQLRELRIVGLDVSPEAVEKSRKRFPHVQIIKQNMFGREEDWDWETSGPKRGIEVFPRRQPTDPVRQSL
jgi:hypothetical protein